MALTLEIMHDPVPWSTHRGIGKRSYNPRFKEKEFYQWQIRAHYNRKTPITGPVRLQFTFHMPIPKNTSRARRAQMLNGLIHHISRPDCTNLQKFSEDCLKGIVIEDDSQVVEVESSKIYSERPRTVIEVQEIDWGL